MEEKYIKYFTEIEVKDKEQKRYINRALTYFFIFVVISRFSAEIKPILGNIFYVVLIIIFSSCFLYNFYRGSGFKPTTKEMLFYDLYIIKANLDKYIGNIEDKSYIKRVFKSLSLTGLNGHFLVQTNTGFDVDLKMESAINTFYENVPHYRNDLEKDQSQDNLRKYSSFFSNVLDYLYEEDFDKFGNLVKKNYKEEKSMVVPLINQTLTKFPSLGGYIIVTPITLITGYVIYSYFDLSLSTEVSSILTTITIMVSIIYFIKTKIYDELFTARKIPQQ